MRPLELFTLFFICGILISDFGILTFILFAVSVGAAFFLLSLRYVNDERGMGVRKKSNYLRGGIIIASLLFLCLGYNRMNQEKAGSFKCDRFDRSLKNVTVSGEVTDYSLSEDGYQIIINNIDILLSSDDTDLENQLNTMEGIIVNSGYLPAGLLTGDTIEASGTLSPCLPATNEGQFDACRYYALKGIHARLYVEDLFCKGKKPDNYSGEIRNYLFKIRTAFINGINSVLPKKEAGIMCAMLAGERSFLEEDIKDIYSQAGLAHVLSISGLHISLLGMGLFEILIRISKRLKLSVLITILVMFLYGVLTGFSISTERAFIMLACMLPARIIGRAYDGQSAAALAALIILFSRPGYLFDSGFQMSFCAVFGIFAGNQIKQELKITNRLLVWILPCISAQLAVFPILLKTYYYFSPYSILVNSLLIPLMSVILIMGLLAGLFASLCIATGLSFLMLPAAVAAGPDFYLLRLFEATAKLVTGLPDSQIIAGAPDSFMIPVYYLIFFFMIYLVTGKKLFTSREQDKKIILDKKLRKSSHGVRLFRRIRMFSGGFIICLISICIIRIKDNSISCSFLDVGQGLCMHISDEKCNILVDGGSTSKQSVGKYIIKPYLLYNGVRRLDYCIVTHTDSDHINGLKELMKDGMIEIGALAVSIDVEETDPLVQTAVETGIPVVYLKAGDIIEAGNIMLDVISPLDGYIYSDDNSESLVFNVSAGEFDILVTGDSGFESENNYISRLNTPHISTEILQVPHHGSKYSSSEEMLSAVRPGISVISCSKYNSYGHPATATLERLEQAGSSVMTTYDFGMIRFRYE